MSTEDEIGYGKPPKEHGFAKVGAVTLEAAHSGVRKCRPTKRFSGRW